MKPWRDEEPMMPDAALNPVLNPMSPCFDSIATPALVLDLGALKRNLGQVATLAGGRTLRPHAKTHKCIEIARMQREAGAIGICCATVAELETLAEAGIGGLLLTAPVAGDQKFQKLAQLARRHEFMMVADHPDQVAALRRHLPDDARTIGVLIDVDVGQKRTGVSDPASSVALARAIVADPRLRFAGLQGFAGQVQHIVARDSRRQAAIVVGNIIEQHRQALAAAGFACAIVSGSGTGAAAFDRAGPYTELQVGSYIFMDADYGKLRDDDRASLPFEPSLFVLATVVSSNRPSEITVDAGVKALAFNGPTPSLMIGTAHGSTYRFGGDEHGVITIPDGKPVPALGERVLIMATHCDPTVNLFSRYQVVDGDRIIATWPIVARHA